MQTKKQTCIIIAYCNEFKIFPNANSSNVKQFDTRLNLLFGPVSIQFLRRCPNRSRELGRVNGSALLGPKRYFFHTDCAFFDLHNVCVKHFLRFVLALCVSCTDYAFQQRHPAGCKNQGTTNRNDYSFVFFLTHEQSQI